MTPTGSSRDGRFGGPAGRDRTTLTDRWTVVIVRRKRFNYEWTVEGPYKHRVRRGVALSAGQARRHAFRIIWEPFFSMFDRRERLECQIVERTSMLPRADPEPLAKELLDA